MPSFIANRFQVCLLSEPPQTTVLNHLRALVLKSFGHLLVISMIIVITALAHGVAAQNPTATLSGTITDQNGSVIPGVNVAVINLDRGFQREIISDKSGSFVVTLLPPGKYIIKAEHEGFAPTEVRDVVLNVNDQINIKIELQVGRLTREKVDVLETPTLVDVAPYGGAILDRQFLEHLPGNGRSFQSYISLAPGVNLVKTGSEKGQFSANGQRGDANNVMVDGVSANVGTSSNTTLEQSGAGTLPAFNVFGGTSNLVSVDALEQFKVLTSAFAPEFGRTPGAQISIATRAGTNEFHGTLFEYFRNEVLDANDWFANQKRIGRLPLRQNVFGGVVGGPLLKNNLFFFFSYEGLRLRQPKVAITQVPSLSARRNASPSIQPFLNAYPLPNGRDLGNNIAELTAGYSDRSNLDATSIRIDSVISPKLFVFGRYNDSPSDASERSSFGTRSVNSVSTTRLKTQTLTVGTTWMVTQLSNDDLRFNWSRLTGRSRSDLDEFGGAVVPADSVFFPPFASKEDSVFVFAPVGLTAGQLAIGKNASNEQRQINLVDTWATVKGPHTLKAGLDYRSLEPTLSILKYQAAYIFFGGITGAMAGKADIVALAGDSGPRYPRYRNFSAFIQDAWKMNPSLMLTYGMRWEVNPPPSERTGNDPFTVTNLDNPSSLALAPTGTPLYQTTYNNFAPRIGISYQISGRSGRELVARGGFGLFYDLGTGATGGAFSRFPYTVNLNVPNVAFPANPSAVPIPPITLNPPFAAMQVFDPNLKLPRTYKWSAGVEQLLGRNQTVGISYVAAVGRRLIRNERLVNPNANFTTVNVGTNTATSDYHALQVEYNRRLSDGLQVLASYTWSHSIDIASNDVAGNLPSFRVDPNQERGDSDFDIRHSFSIAVSYNIAAPNSLKLMRPVLSHWSIDAIYRARSAAPVNVVTGQALFGVTSPPVGRPNLILGVPLYLQDSTVGGGRRINPAAFSLPAAGQQGSLGRNALRGFPLSQLDFAVRREFSLFEPLKVQLKVEFFNLFNHPNFGDPGFGFSNTNALNNSLFGRSTVMYGRGLGSGGSDGGFNPLYQVGGPRSTQFSLRFLF